MFLKLRISYELIWAIYNDLSRGHPKWWFSTFASAIKFLQRKNILRLPKLAPRVSMSSMLGLAEKYAGLALRPKLTHDTYAAIWLQKAIPYFCPARGNLNFVLNHIPAMQNLDTSDGNVGHSL